MTPGSGRRTRRRLRGLALPLTLVALAVVVIGISSATSARTPGLGPLEGGNTDVEAGVGMPSLTMGQTFCYGMVVLRNASRRQVTLTDVEVHGGEGLRVGLPRVMGPRRADTFGTADTCPSGARPLRGYVVAPGSGASDLGIEVLLPITVTRRGKSRIDGVSVHYRSGRRSYQVDDLTNVVACTYACDARPGGG